MNYRCLPIPDNEVLCRQTLNLRDFSVPITTQLVSFIAEVGMSADNLNIEIPTECLNFLTFYQCSATYTPCNGTSKKIYSFCENSCDIINKLTQLCLNFTRDPYISQFNCSNPLTYTSSLTLDFYEEPPDDICNATLRLLGKHTL